MKKIMFNDRYGLTQAVLNGNKTMTRRIIKDGVPLGNWDETEKHSRYKIGEIVAVAQPYCETALIFCPYADLPFIKTMKGWNNKMYVRASLMPNLIRITDIKVERLQEISDEDCIKEGISEMYDAWYEPQVIETVVGTNVAFVDPFGFNDVHNKIFRNYPTPREAFADLIDRVSGKGTWTSNLWVFAYTFELVKGGKG